MKAMSTRVLARTTAREITFEECRAVGGAGIFGPDGTTGFVSYDNTECFSEYLGATWYGVDDAMVSDRDV